MKKERSYMQCLKELRQIPHYADADYDGLRERLGEELLTKRLNRQLVLYDTHRTGEGLQELKWHRKVMRTLVRYGLACTGLLEKARKNARSPILIEREVVLANLPETFDGYRILHLSDFHFDFIPELPEILRELLEGVEFDVCFLTGDYRGETTGAYEQSLDHLSRCHDLFGEKVYSVLGNHDNVELLTGLSEMGIVCLMNESVELLRGGESLLVYGVDDPQHYRTHSLDMVMPQEEKISILLSHTPEIGQEAADAGFDLMLSGHTHGGQICLPGGIPVMGHIGKAPRRCIRGEWQMGTLQGYTSCGVGSSSIDVRLNCPPEITVHILRRA